MRSIDSVPLSHSSQLLMANATPHPQVLPGWRRCTGERGQASRPHIHAAGWAVTAGQGRRWPCIRLPPGDSSPSSSRGTCLSSTAGKGRLQSYPGFPRGSDRKESPCNAGDSGSILGSGRSPGRKWLPTPVFLPGESHRQRSLVGYSL